MHTSFYTSCNIIHNGDYSGEIYVRNENNSERTGKVAEIRTTTKALILSYKNTETKPKTLILIGTGKESTDREMTVLFKDIEDFVKDILLDKIQSKLEGRLSMEKILKVSDILGC